MFRILITIDIRQLAWILMRNSKVVVILIHSLSFKCLYEFNFLSTSMSNNETSLCISKYLRTYSTAFSVSPWLCWLELQWVSFVLLPASRQYILHSTPYARPTGSILLTALEWLINTCLKQQRGEAHWGNISVADKISGSFHVKSPDHDTHRPVFS